MPATENVTTQDSGQQATATALPASQTQGQQTQTTDQSATQRTAADPNAGRQTEPRDQGLIRDLQSERKARQALELRIKELSDQQTARDQRLTHAIAGTTPVDAEEKQIREAFAQLYPGLAKLTDEQIGKLLALSEKAQTFEETSTHIWDKHSRQMIDSVIGKVAERLGGKDGKLSDRQRKAVVRFYVGEAEADENFLSRHTDGDPTLVDEVVNAFVEDWFEPARRSVTATEVQRTSRRVPRGNDRSVGITGKKPLDFKDEKAVADAMVESFRAHGGTFEG